LKALFIRRVVVTAASLISFSCVSHDCQDPIDAPSVLALDAINGRTLCATVVMQRGEFSGRKETPGVDGCCYGSAGFIELQEKKHTGTFQITVSAEGHQDGSAKMTILMNDYGEQQVSPDGPRNG